MNELFDQLNAYQLKEIQAKIITEISFNLSSYESRKEAVTLEPIHEREIEVHKKEKGYNDFERRSIRLMEGKQQYMNYR